jgi:comEA protein
LLVFVTNSSHLISCTPDDGGLAGDRLVRDYFSRYWVEFEGSDAVEFHLTHGNWVRLLRTNGFVIEDLVETRPSEGAIPRTPIASADWAQRWPSEEIWVARKVVPPSLSDDASESESLPATEDVQEPPETLESQGHPERHHPLREHVAASEEQRADGALRDADGAGMDLAASLVEEVQILVPLRAAATDVSAPDSSPTDGTGVVDSTVSLSSATLEDLAQLPKVGPVTAQKIVEYRTEHGSFASVDDLVAVPGFGPTRVEQLREFVRP